MSQRIETSWSRGLIGLGGPLLKPTILKPGQPAPRLIPPTLWLQPSPSHGIVECFVQRRVEEHFLQATPKLTAVLWHNGETCPAREALAPVRAEAVGHNQAVDQRDLQLPQQALVLALHVLLSANLDLPSEGLVPLPHPLLAPLLPQLHGLACPVSLPVASSLLQLRAILHVRSTSDANCRAVLLAAFVGEVFAVTVVGDVKLALRAELFARC
mmetsp:Transcript_5429/g.10972  ORF Transcript_5429/g.10972 Transcript_5429/m.10972 type:complete len:213 (+) Transcript_5429:1254-1892(+)